MERQPTIVCLCGSARFTDAVYSAYAREALRGNLVLTYLPERDSWNSREWHNDTELKASLDKLHFHRIDLCDEILVLNVGGYVGESTKREISYARALGKKVRWLEHDVPAWKKILNKARRKLGYG